MWKEFQAFLFKSNALALAIGVIIGAAVGKVVTSIVGDLLMPVIGLILPGGGWRTWAITLSHNPDGTAKNALMVGSFLGNVIDLLIIGFVVFQITRTFLKPAPPPPGPPTKECPYCMDVIPAGAKKCRSCTSQL
ncbi:MAG: large conductance mechanosensitive channel protein MscL [Candidatus Eisenbacteria bacterium]|nr:large conductance mechanosensitive channel protein MscL [Candidatus Eisenbacteria bacterium]